MLRALCFTNSITWHFFIIFTRNLGPVLTIAIHINIPNPKYTYMNFKDPEIVKRNHIPDQTKHFFEHGPNTSLKIPENVALQGLPGNGESSFKQGGLGYALSEHFEFQMPGIKCKFKGEIQQGEQ